jgi:hypothetical protein
MTKTGRRRLFVACGIVSLVPIAFALGIFFSALLTSGGNSAVLARASVSDGDVPVGMTVFGRSTDTISARFSFRTTDGETVSTLERSWDGWELRFDCVLVKTGSGWLVFPYSMSTDRTDEGRGVNLLRYYDRSGFPSIYESSRLSSAERLALKRVFSVVRMERWLPRFFGNVHHETAVIRSFEPNVEYLLHVAKDGTVNFSGDQSP